MSKAAKAKRAQRLLKNSLPQAPIKYSIEDVKCALSVFDKIDEVFPFIKKAGVNLKKGSTTSRKLALRIKAHGIILHDRILSKRTFPSKLGERK